MRLCKYCFSQCGCDCSSTLDVARQKQIPEPTELELAVRRLEHQVKALTESQDKVIAELAAVNVFLASKFADLYGQDGMMMGVGRWYEIIQQERRERARIEKMIRDVEALGYMVSVPSASSTPMPEPSHDDLTEAYSQVTPLEEPLQVMGSDEI